MSVVLDGLMCRAMPVHVVVCALTLLPLRGLLHNTHIVTDDVLIHIKS